LLTCEFPGRDALVVQSRSMTVVREDEGSGTLSLVLNVADASPPAQVDLRVPVEAIAPHVEDVPVHVLLHVANGLLHELEVLRLDGEPLGPLPSPDDFAVRRSADD
jgi:hypothetical protein